MHSKYIILLSQDKTDVFNDDALDTLISIMANDKSKIWNSVQIAEQYFDYGGSHLSRKNITAGLCEHFGSDLLSFIVTRCCKPFGFPSAWQVEYCRCTGRVELKRLVYDICNETRKTDNSCDLSLNNENLNNGVSDTLLNFVKEVKIPELVSAFISNVITCCIPKPLYRTFQLAIAVFLKRKIFYRCPTSLWHNTFV